MSKLIKRLENDTDFDVCVHQLKDGRFAVTVWDAVARKHELRDTKATLDEASAVAEELNNAYKID